MITYRGLVESLWRQMDPTDGTGSFVDRGSQYRPGIFFHNETQRRIAEQSMLELAASGRYSQPLATELTQLETFYPAEEYHQDYYKRARSVTSSTALIPVGTSIYRKPGAMTSTRTSPNLAVKTKVSNWSLRTVMTL
ncbi:peptide-methionine (S)-S-oxide reductase [Aliamphritea spongicola]|nr:peptide-methionine (S)-S-oxide reductase [Aliamphritea spongicola]